MNNNNFAPVSVIIPCYNCRDTIERALQSVYMQSWKPVEVILVDDASTDGTWDKLMELQKKYGHDLIKIIHLEQNSGPGNARNKGWDVATQPYIAFLDADDTWHPEKIAIQLSYMMENPDLAITGHYRNWIKENDFTVKSKQFSENYKVTAFSKQKFLLSNRFSTPTVMLRRELDCRFEPNKRFSEDYLLWLNIILSGHKAALINLELAYIYKAPYGERGLSAKLWEMEKGELQNYATLLKFNKISFLEWLFFDAYSIVKFILRFIRRILGI